MKFKLLLTLEKAKKIFQIVPHLVLLSEDFYWQHLITPVSKWALVWLQEQSTIDFKERQESYALFCETILAYISSTGQKYIDAGNIISQMCDKKLFKF